MYQMSINKKVLFFLLSLIIGCISISLKISIIVILSIIFLFLLISFEAEKFIYLVPFSLIVFAIYTVPWSKNAVRVASIPIVYIPYIIFGIFVFLSVFFIKKKYSLYLGANISSKAIIFFLVYASLSLLWVHDIKSWGVYIVQWYVYIIAILFGTSNLYYKDAIKIVKFLKFNCTAMSIICLIGLLRYFLIDEPYVNPILLLNRNSVIFILIPYFSILIAMKSYYNKKTVYYTIVGIFIFTIILMFSRTGYLMMVVTSTIYFSLVSKDIKLSKKIITGFRIIIILSAMLILIGIFLPINIKMEISHRISEFSNALNFLEGDTEKISSSDIRRVALVQAGVKIIKENWLLGTGVGLQNYLWYYPNDFIVQVPARAHNFYISYLAEMGIIGFSSLILFFITTMLYICKSTKDIASKKVKAISYGFLSGHITILIGFVTGEYITSPNIWFFWGLAFAYCKNIKEIDMQFDQLKNRSI